MIYCNMSEEKDGLKSIKAYKFNNMKESWHEFALKFRVIADDRVYDDIIEGIVTPPDEKEDLEILDKDNAAVKKSKKVLPLVLKTCNTFRYVVHFLQRISKPEKNHTGPFSTLKGYFRRI